MERIAHAGIKCGSEILVGKSHQEIRDKFPVATKDTSRIAQGFVTSKGRFVCRLIATDIAFEAKQLCIDHYELIGGGELISENLWDYGGFDYSSEKGYFRTEETKLKQKDWEFYDDHF